MVYIRKKKIRGNTYYYVVEGKVDESGKLKQKVLLYLGTVQTIVKVFTFYKRHR